MPVVNHSYNQTLSLLQATPGGAATLTTIAEVDWSGSGPISFTNPNGQIPDGSGGIFASWYTTTGSTLVNHISHITSAGVIDSTPSFQGPILPDGMVDGESGTLFATDGLSVSSFSSSLSSNWMFTAPVGLNISTATSDEGATIADGSSSYTQIDPLGVQGNSFTCPSCQPSTVQGEFYSLNTNASRLAGINSIVAPSIWPTRQGHRQGRSASPPTASIRLRFTCPDAPSCPLTFGNNLVYPTAQTCNPDSNQNIGLQDCSAKSAKSWAWNLEAIIEVSDDASNWTIDQTLNSNHVKGIAQDTTGQLHFFDVTQSEQPDGPSDQFIQQPSGQTKIFYLDAPTIATQILEGTVISATKIANFTTRVCSTKKAALCFSQKWHVKIVVGPGGLLNLSDSTADIGFISTNM